MCSAGRKLIHYEVLRDEKIAGRFISLMLLVDDREGDSNTTLNKQNRMLVQLKFCETSTVIDHIKLKRSNL